MYAYGNIALYGIPRLVATIMNATFTGRSWTNEY